MTNEKINEVGTPAQVFGRPLKNHFAFSTRNVFSDRIVEIQDSGSLVRLKVDVGKPFVVQITKRSFRKMELNLNAEVFLAFKASSVQMV